MTDMRPAQASRTPGSRWQVRCAMQTDVGCVRTHNEDAVGCMIPREDDPFARAGTLAVVADGMGGHAAGEVASRIALRTMLHEYYRSAATPAAALEHALALANRAICERAAADPACAGMGTTCSAVAIVGGLAYFAHVGDSRIYLLRGEGFRQLTEDDSLVGQMLRGGLLTAEEARAHPDRHVLLRVLGTRDFQPDVAPAGLALEDADILLLCTDGITDQIDDAMLASVLRSQAPVDACSRLIDLARMAGGLDNATVAICDLQPQPADADHAAVRSTRETRAY